MKLRLDRIYLGKKYTIGHLYINGVYFCDTLEDAVRKVKIPKITAIWAGIYEIILYPSPHFGREVPLLKNVPQFTYVEMHVGNDAEDTDGCILLGENKIKGKVINSTGYEMELVNKIKEALNKREKITIEIINK